MALRGVQVIELAGLAPAPFCGMILADFGASVIRVDKLAQLDVDCLGNGKRSITLNLKSAEGVTILKRLSKKADVLIEPYRPGVMEKLGLGPDTLMKENKRLIFARLSGFGQVGPMSQTAGHDINALAVSGMLSVMGGSSRVPCPPVNFAADFAGGGSLCALGIVMALFERNTSGLGQVIDANMTSTVAYVGSWLARSRALQMLWSGPRGTNLLDGGSHFYCCYETKDGKFMAVGAIEPQFYSSFIRGLGLDLEEVPQVHDPAEVAKAKAKIEGIFKKHTQQHWIEVYTNLDACVSPVLEIDEAAETNEGMYTRCGKDVYAPNPAPLLSRTPGQTQSTKPRLVPGQNSLEILRDAGFSKSEIEQFLKSNAISSSSKL